jgi:hypothetical protein
VRRQLRRRRGRWKGNTKIDFRETGMDEANWVRLAQDRIQWHAFVNTVMSLRVPERKLSNHQLFKEYPEPWSE